MTTIDVPEVVVTLPAAHPGDGLARLILEVATVTVDGIPLLTIGDVKVETGTHFDPHTGRQAPEAIATVTLTIPVTRFAVAEPEPEPEPKAVTA